MERNIIKKYRDYVMTYGINIHRIETDMIMENVPF